MSKSERLMKEEEERGLTSGVVPRSLFCDSSTRTVTPDLPFPLKSRARA